MDLVLAVPGAVRVFSRASMAAQFSREMNYLCLLGSIPPKILRSCTRGIRWAMNTIVQPVGRIQIERKSSIWNSRVRLRTT